MKAYLPAAVAATLLLGAAPAVASELFDDSVSACTGLNCSSIRLPVTVTRTPEGNAHPWVGQLYAQAGECIRIQVLSQTGGADLELTNVAPDGTVFRNDDSGIAGCPLCSLVKFVSNNQGWGTVALNDFAGRAVGSNAIIVYGRYLPASNPNCASATPPAAATSSARK